MAAVAALAALGWSTGAWAASTYYVSPTGSDTGGDGSQGNPFKSWARAQTAVAAGDTVYFRGGTYAYTDATSTCTSGTATINAVVLSKSGTQGNPIHYFAYPGEHPVFDFSGISDTSKYSCRQVGVRVEADWLYLKGLELKGTLQLNNLNHESWCVYVTGGSNNVFEQLDAHHNNGPGFFVQQGGNNTFLNCDSHENEDTMTSNGDGQSADGFGCHPNRTGDTGNLFHGCRAWWNSDDSWDFINATEACTVEYSWAWYAGYKPDALSNGAPVALAAGNGNGFKGGGYGDPQANVPTPTPIHVIRMNAAFYNKANGLYANHEIVSPIFYNNTSFNNGADVNMLGLDGTTVTSVGTLRNNLAFATNGHGLTTNMTYGGPISDTFNSWDTSLGVTPKTADFQSLAFSPPASCPQAFAPGGTPCCAATDMTCFAGMASARNADGSLPTLPFLRLASTSDLIDKGTDVGLPFTGKEPDLGCFETGAAFDPGDGGAPVSDAGGTGSSTSSTSRSGTTTGGSSSSGGGTGTATGSTSGGASSGGSTAHGSTAVGGSSGGTSASGAESTGGSGSGSSGAPGESSGCSCHTGGAPARGGGWLLVALGLLAARRRKG